MTQPYNAQLIDQLATDFPKRMDSTYSWGQVVAGFVYTPDLIAFWPTSSVDYLGFDMRVYDASLQGRVLFQSCWSPD